MQSRPLVDLRVGDKASFTKTITETDVALYAAISGDFNPLHVDAEFAARGPFGERVAHGPLTLALAAGVLGTMLPGVGTVALSMGADFRAPVRIGDTITARAEVAALDLERNRATMALSWSNQAAETIASGEAVVSPPRRDMLA